MIEVLATGPLATVQDGGRAGWAHLGVSRSGAADRGALARANRLVGNPPGAAGVEITLGGLSVRWLTATTVAVTGAPCPGVDCDVAVSVAGGTVTRLGLPQTGARSYLAVRGGIEVSPVLGSRSTDTLSGLGPPPLRAGTRLAIGAIADQPVSGAVAVAPFAPSALRVVAGPRSEWFMPNALTLLGSSAWTVLADSNRIGIRLDGPPLIRRHDGDLPSEPTTRGALQVPPDGRPILLGPDAPVTGGYPVLAVVRDADLDHAAQLRPGDAIGFRL